MQCKKENENENEIVAGGGWARITTMVSRIPLAGGCRVLPLGWQGEKWCYRRGVSDRRTVFSRQSTNLIATRDDVEASSASEHVSGDGCERVVVVVCAQMQDR